MVDYRKIITNRELRLRLISLLSFIPDKPYLKMVFRIKTGRKLNFNNPVSFDEKLNWLKLNDRHEEYTRLVDKILVRDYVTDKIGAEYLIPLIGTWNRFQDIDFNTLPEKFVLKCNHDSGSVKVITSKSSLTPEDFHKMEKFFDFRLKLNPFCLAREYPYKNVQPRIIAEKYIETEDNNLKDYKFFCFDGKPQFLFIVNDRFNSCTFDYFDMDFKHLSFTNGDHPQSSVPVPCPSQFELMKELAGKLSQGMKQVRVDFYETNGRVYFGELTFFSDGGYTNISPHESNVELGKLIKL